MHVRCVIFNSCWLRPLSFVTRILVRSMQLASLITAVALLLLSVRGKFGVEIWAQCLTIRRLRLLANDRLAVFFKNYYKAVTQLMRKKGLLHKDVSHNEGRTHRTTGLNPLSACAKSAEARKDFVRVVQAWTPIFERALSHGYCVQTSDLLEIRDAALGRVPFLLYQGKVHHWWRYSAMSATRTCELLFQMLGRAPTVLSAEIYDVLKEDQALGQANEEETRQDVFVQCHVNSFHDFRELGSRLQTAVRLGSGYVGSVLRCNAKLVWQGELVALCEVRQSAQRYTWIGLEKITKELIQREDIRIELQREQQSVLMQKTYVGMCHSSYMFSRANKLLELDVPISKSGSGPALSKARCWKLLQDSCRLGLCPKVLLPNISEWVALATAFRAISEKAKVLRTTRLDNKNLRKTAQKLGYRGVKQLSKPDLHRKIRSGKERPRLRWSDWAEKCKKLGINANPRCQNDARKKMSVPEMRRALLHKSPKIELCDIASRGAIATSGKRKHDLIDAILLVKDLC